MGKGVLLLPGKISLGLNFLVPELGVECFRHRGGHSPMLENTRLPFCVDNLFALTTFVFGCEKMRVLQSNFPRWDGLRLQLRP